VFEQHKKLHLSENNFHHLGMKNIILKKLIYQNKKLII